MSEAIKQFADYFAKNYPADTVIVDPHWHAPRIFRAVVAALSAEQPKPVAWLISTDKPMPGFPFATSNREVVNTCIEGIHIVTPLCASPIAAPASQPADASIKAAAFMQIARNSVMLFEVRDLISTLTDPKAHCPGRSEEARRLLPLLNAYLNQPTALSHEQASQPDAAAIRNKALDEAVAACKAVIEQYRGSNRGKTAEVIGDNCISAIRALAQSSQEQQEQDGTCVKCPRDPHKVCDYCGLQQAGQPAPALPEWWHGLIDSHIQRALDIAADHIACIEDWRNVSNALHASRDALRAIRQPQDTSPAAQGEFVLVPKEPTEEMRLAGKHALKGAADLLYESEQALCVYGAMINAAPAQEGENK